MAQLLDSNELSILAFRKKVDETRIPDATIEMVQERYLKPVLTSIFYTDLITNPGTYQSDTALMDKVKMVVAFYTKYHILPDIHLQVGQGGIGAAQGRGRQTLGFEGLSVAMDEALNMANLYSGRLTDYLNDNQATYPLYQKWRNPNNLVGNAGGILYRHYELEDDDN